eukprot:g16572.t1
MAIQSRSRKKLYAAPAEVAAKEKVQKLAKFVADGFAYMMDNAVDESGQELDADALADVVVATQEAAIVAIAEGLETM